MKKEDIILKMQAEVYELGMLDLDVEYSLGENPNELELEWISVSEDNNLSEEQEQLANGYIEDGLEEHLDKVLQEYYSQKTDIIYIPKYSE